MLVEELFAKDLRSFEAYPSNSNLCEKLFSPLQSPATFDKI